MKVLKVSRDIFKFLGICPIDDQTTHRKQMLHNLFGWLAVFILGSMIVLSSVCAINYIPIDFNDALYAAFTTIAALRVRLFVTLVSMVISRKNHLFYEKLQKFSDQSNLIFVKHLIGSINLFFYFLDGWTKSRGFFEKTNKSSNKTCKYLTIYFPLIFVFEMISEATISVLNCYITKGYVEADYLFAPYEFV